jgi:biopolymer transport protein ExbD
MAGAVGKSKGQMAGINITPLVDVVLVLLIIFMLVIKGDSVEIPNIIPKKADAEEAVALESQQLVLELLKNGDLMLNGNPVKDKDFPDMFHKLMESRSDKKLFVSADDEVLWDQVVYWMSVARRNGAGLVALQMIPPQYESISK